MLENTMNKHHDIIVLYVVRVLEKRRQTDVMTVLNRLLGRIKNVRLGFFGGGFSFVSRDVFMYYIVYSRSLGLLQEKLYYIRCHQPSVMDVWTAEKNSFEKTRLG